MSGLRHWIFVVGMTGSTFFLAAIGLLVVAQWIEWAPPVLPPALIPVFVLTILVVPTVLAVLVARLVGGRHGSQPVTRRRPVVFGLALAYVITAIAGIPAVQSAQNERAVSEYKRLRASGSTRVWDVHPRIRTYVAIPIAPALILTYHEYQLDALYGFGGFELWVWYGSGVRSLAALPLWLS